MQYTTAELERRIARVRVLLDTHDDIYDDLSRCETATARSGFGEPVVSTMRCGHCGGEGCGQCGNVGRVKVARRDPYDTGVGAFDPVARDQREDAARVEAILDRIRKDELLRKGEIATVDFEAMLDRAEGRDRRGSYRELRAALDSMPASVRGAGAVVWLATHLPKTIRIPQWAYERELDEIRDEVLELKEAGLKVSEIADALSISQRQVKANLRSAKSS